MNTEVSYYPSMGEVTGLIALACLLVVQVTCTAGLVSQDSGTEDVQPVHTFSALDCRTPVKV